MIKELLFLFLLTFVPVGELRFSIPVGLLSHKFIETQLPILPVFLTCLIANIVLGIILYKLLLNFKIERFPKANYFLQKAHKRLKPFTQKYGTLGVLLFVSIPLPGSGSWTAAFGSYVLGLKEKQFYIANTIGVTIAAILVTLITLGIIG